MLPIANPSRLLGLRTLSRSFMMNTNPRVTTSRSLASRVTSKEVAKEVAPPAVQKQKKPITLTKEELLAAEPALGVNRAYDEALKWFGGLRDAAKSRVEVARKDVESLKTAVAALEAKNDPALADQIAELKGNLVARDAKMQKDADWLFRSDPVREKKARLLLEVIPTPPVENMTNEDWKIFGAHHRLRHMGRYWGIFDDVLVGNPITPSINLVAKYADQVVHRGSEMQPAQTIEKPAIKFGSDKRGAYYTLLLVDADEPNPAAKKLDESVHWLVTNIPGKASNTEVSAGSTVLDYIPPHPSQGSNFHRFVFVLFEQRDSAIEVQNAPALGNRFMSTKSFADTHSLTPVGFSFFRAQWDQSVTGIYTDILKKKEPIWKESKETSPAASSSKGRRR